MKYFLDDLSIKGFLDNSSNPSSDICELADLVDEIINFGESVAVPDSIDSYLIGKNILFQDIYSFDFSHDDIQLGIDRDKWMRLFILRGKLENITVNTSIEVTIYDNPGALSRTKYSSDTASMAHSETKNDDPFSLLTMGCATLKPGEHKYHIDNESHHREIYVLKSKDDLPANTRWFIQILQLSEEDFFSLWSRAFPFLLKSDDLSFRRFNGEYSLLRAEVIKHLSFLNDHFISFWKQCNYDFPCFMRRAKSEHGIDFSNESSNTRKSTKKMNQRAAMFSGKPVTCEIHTKIRPLINRIHFHPPKPEISGEKVLIGIFVDHLET